MLSPDTLTLPNGAQMPKLGLGTWRLAGDRCIEVVQTALRLGYRHIDTAQMYQNEAEVGAALRTSGLARDEVFLTTKIWPDRHQPKEFVKAVDESLAALQLDHVDLLLLHWPSLEAPLAETLGALNAVHRAGKARAIGLSNFTVALMQRAAALSETPLAVNQIEYHVLLRQNKVPACARRLKIALTAYRPLAKGLIHEYPLLAEIGAQYNKTPAQVALRWLIQQPDVSAIPKVSSEPNLRENLNVFDFNLNEDDLERINTLPNGQRYSDAAWAPAWDAM